MMNNENVNPSSPFTTPFTTSTLTPVEGESMLAEPTVAFADDDYHQPENNASVDNDEESQETNEDTSTSTTDLHAAIERRFNESTNANSSERSIQEQHPASSRHFREIFPQRENQHNGNKPGTPVFSFSRSSRRKARDKKHTTVTADPLCEGYNIEQRNCNMFECTGETKCAALFHVLIIFLQFQAFFKRFAIYNYSGDWGKYAIWASTKTGMQFFSLGMHNNTLPYSAEYGQYTKYYENRFL